MPDAPDLDSQARPRRRKLGFLILGNVDQPEKVGTLP